MSDDSEKRRNDRWETKMEFGGGNSNVWTGIFILLIGVAALIRVSVPDLPNWLFSWKILLIALGLFIGFRHGFKGPAWIILILIGSAFLLRDMYPELPIRQYIWPSILVLVGAVMILRPKRNYWECDDSKKKNQDNIVLE